MLELTVVADDLTGAADSGAPFAAAFAPAWLMDHRRLAEPDPSAEDPPRVLSVFTSTRNTDPAAARKTLRRASRALAARRPGRVFKKIDSGLRGNIGAEMEALMEGLALDLSFIAPAFPEQGRTTRDGIHRLHGVPVDRTEMARDPLTPVTDARIDRWVARQTRHACAHVGLALLDAGDAAVSAEIDRRVAAGFRHLIFDAETDDHLERIAALALRRYPQALLCGSAGLARRLAAVLPGPRAGAGPRREPGPAPGFVRVLFLCGSASAALRLQSDALAQAGPVPLVELSPAALLAADAFSERGAALNRAADALGRGSVVVRTAAPGRTAAGVDPRALAAALGRFALELIAARRPDGLFMSGGDTAAAVLEAGGFHSIRLERELADGVVLGTVRGGALAGLTVTTKAGAFGRPDALRRLHAALAPGAGPR